MALVGGCGRRGEQGGGQADPGKHSREHAHAVIPFGLGECEHAVEPNAELLHKHYLRRPAPVGLLIVAADAEHSVNGSRAPAAGCENRPMRTPSRGSVLVVDDEPTIAEIVSRYLERAGYQTTIAHDGAEALASAERGRPDLVVLDLMLPGVDGLEVMRRLREDEAPPGVILLTAKGEESDRVIGLRQGADDYVVKPFSPAELVARVDAVLRRVERPVEDPTPLVVGEIGIDPVSREVTVRDEPVTLTQREFDLLLFMARHPHQAFSRNQLMDAVWQYSFYTDTSTVTVHIRRLRTKLERDPSHPRHLETVWGIGYRFAP